MSAETMDASELVNTQDSDWLMRCRAGDLDAYRYLVERYQAPLCSWLTGRLRDPDAAEEVAQEAFVRAWLMLGRFQQGAAFFPWVCGIAAQVAREDWRSRRRRDRHFQLKAESQGEALNVSATTGKEWDIELRAAIDALPGAHRDVVLLRYYGQCSCREAAERLGLPLGTVTKRLSRAHAELRAWFQKHADKKCKQ